MIHGYHVIFGTYGFWLPNDPRGSWSEFVGSWELLQFGKPTWSTNRRELSKAEQLARGKAKKSLKFPEVTLSGHQALAVGTGFANSVRKSSYTVWACSILPQHVHLVLGRHEYQVEQVVNLMKGEATKQLTSRGVHPMADFKSPAGKAPTPWASRRWKVYLDSEESVENAIHYVESNPEKEGLPKQTWSFVQPLRGLDNGWVTYR